MRTEERFDFKTAPQVAAEVAMAIEFLVFASLARDKLSAVPPQFRSKFRSGPYDRPSPTVPHGLRVERLDEKKGLQPFVASTNSVARQRPERAEVALSMTHNRSANF